MNRTRVFWLLTVTLLVTCVLSQSFATIALAATNGQVAPSENGNFSLQVTPSPLVMTIRPGQTTTQEIKIRNGGTATEKLKVETRSFKIDKQTGKVTLDDTAPSDIGGWIKYSAPTFGVAPGQWFSEMVSIALPKDTGFSYSFAIVISRQKDIQPTNGGRLIKGSLAIFALINVDRPGASRKLEVAQFEASKHVYEYLPTELSIKLKNTGNSIVQPYGNVFIQRGDKQKPLAVLPVNEQKGYFLPGVQRSLDSNWKDGFPHYESTTSSDGKVSRHLAWNWSDLSKLRIGKYTAKLVAVYDDGGHDVPIQGEVNFWVIPWKILLGALVVLLLILLGLYSLVKKIMRLGQKVRRAPNKVDKSNQKPDES